MIALHPDAEGKPCVIGNCQAGWAVMMLAAVRPELFGPIIVPGSPLSYWAGIKGKNPMRYSGGLLGGSWLTALSGDLGAGKFDGAALVGNFENLDPANTYWKKNYNLWSNVDTEAERFLEFETWWGGHVNLNAEEMQWIADQLFIGNRLATAEITTSDGVRVDLRNIARQFSASAPKATTSPRRNRPSAGSSISTNTIRTFRPAGKRSCMQSTRVSVISAFSFPAVSPGRSTRSSPPTSTSSMFSRPAYTKRL